MFQLKDIINNHGTKIKYVLLIFLFMGMILAINTYVNYLEVLESIETVNNKTEYIQNEMDYAKNFQQKYLKSDYGYLFLAHDNSMIFDGEEIILFKYKSELEKTGFNTDLTHIPYRPTVEEERKSMNPKEAWKLYFSILLSEHE